jgi:outer membrane protein assembly factor BamA
MSIAQIPDTATAGIERNSSPVTVAGRRIDAVRIRGNRVTKTRVISRVLRIDPGMLYDSTAVAQARRRLKATDIFNQVDIFPHVSGDSLFLYVMVKERFYLSIDDIGGEWNTSKYARENSWWQLRGSLAHSNFRGMMETFKVRASFWEGRSFGVGWTKPLPPSPWYFGVGMGISDVPDRAMPWRRASLAGSLLAGRGMLDYSRVYAILTPAYRWMSYKGIELPDSLQTVSPDSLQEWKLRHFEYVDTSLRNEKSDTVFNEALFSIGWSTDRRDNTFDTRSGWYLGMQVLTNYLLPNDKRYSFVEFDADTRLYHRGISSNHTVGWWLRGALRDHDAGIFKHLMAGGEGSVRGFPNDYLGRVSSANNRVILSMEYRFPIWTTPAWDVPVLSEIHPGFKNFSYRFDGALLADWGHLWHDAVKPFEVREIGNDLVDCFDDGLGAGAGLRVLVPNFRASLCADFAVGWRKPWREQDMPCWSMNLYVGMYY